MRDAQERAIPLITQGKSDLIIVAATAAGKTEAAFLPIASELGADPPVAPGVRALYLSPLKALINDQFERLSDLFGRVDVPVHRWHGDVPGQKKSEVLRHPDGVLLITPESLEAIFVLRGTSVPVIFAGLRYVVVDELHSFIGTERGRSCGAFSIAWSWWCAITCPASASPPPSATCDWRPWPCGLAAAKTSGSSNRPKAARSSPSASGGTWPWPRRPRASRPPPMSRRLTART